jgi:hypothetical protein
MLNLARTSPEETARLADLTVSSSVASRLRD